MRKILLSFAVAAAALAGTGAAEAHHRGHHGGYHGGHHGGHYGGRHGGYRGGYYGGHHGYRRHKREHYGKYIAGAVVLGAALTAIAANNQPRERVIVRERVIREPAYGSDVWYRLDRYGNCTRVRNDGYGREILTDVDPSYCY